MVLIVASNNPYFPRFLVIESKMLELERKQEVRSGQLSGRRKMKPREVKWLHKATRPGRGRLSPAPVVWPQQLAPNHTRLHTPTFVWFCFTPTRNPQHKLLLPPSATDASLPILMRVSHSWDFLLGCMANIVTPPFLLFCSSTQWEEIQAGHAVSLHWRVCPPVCKARK